MIRRSIAIAVSLLGASSAFADGQTEVEARPVISAPASVEAARPTLVFSLRGGLASNPEYFGSDNNELGPDLAFRFGFARLPGNYEFGNPDMYAVTPRVFNVHGSLRYIGERDSSDYNDLRGMDDVDAALELGAGLGYTTRNFDAFADLRRGFGGHEGWVVEAGADYVSRPTDRLRLNMGPRFLWGDDDYADTYFGVDSAAPGRPLYEADGGLVSAGLEFGANYRLTDAWGLEGAITYDALQNDAADSPLVKDLGDSDQWGVRFGVTRVIQLGF